MKRSLVAGIDACRAGWFIVLAQTGSSLAVKGYRVCRTFADAAAWSDEAAEIAVDIPVGLVESGFRKCDVVAKKLLGARGCCVFLTPPRPVLAAKDMPYAAASALHRRHCNGKGMSCQVHGILPKVAEVDTFLRLNCASKKVFEVHPELSFAAINRGHPVLIKKASDEGLLVRRRLLRMRLAGVDGLLDRALAAHPRVELKPDDVLDAAVAAVTAATWDPAATIPCPEPPVDVYGFKMEMRRPAAAS